MADQYKITAHWLTKKPKAIGYTFALFCGAVLVLATQAYWSGFFRFDQIMLATKHLVFNEHQYWRAWTALFAHSDFGHLLSNSALFIPLTFLLVGYYGFVFFPMVGLFVGGLVNLIVLQGMPAETALLGISGVVNWMGAAWLTLYILIDRKQGLRRRWAHAIFLCVILFIPEKYNPQVSYYSHFLGFVFGVLSAWIFYYINRQKFLTAEVHEPLPDEEELLISP